MTWQYDGEAVGGPEEFPAEFLRGVIALIKWWYLEESNRSEGNANPVEEYLSKNLTNEQLTALILSYIGMIAGFMENTEEGFLELVNGWEAGVLETQFDQMMRFNDIEEEEEK